jgi:tagatose-1,6-bisphosphate aldolase
MTSPTPSYGKLRRLQQCTDESGRFVMLAADQRGNLRRALNPGDPAAVSDWDMTRFKIDLMSVLSGDSSAVLLDPEYGAAQAIAAGVISGSAGLVVALESTGYAESPHDRRSEILPGWSPEQAQQIGASAAKLLIYYHPDAPGAPGQEALIARTAIRCSAVDLPLIVEPLSFPLNDEPLDGPERRRVVVETARRLGSIDGVDLLKMEFPALPDDPDGWEDACRSLDEASSVPWVILSAGVDFATFSRQAETACRAGAVGVLAGRAVWGEATAMSRDERLAFFATVGRERMATLSRIVRHHARPWIEPDPDAGEIPSDWYRR